MDAPKNVTPAALTAAQAPARVTDGPVAFVISVRIRAGAEEEFLALLTPLLDAMRHEPTFINAVLHRDPEDSCHFMLYETWADLRDVTEVQLNRAYRAAFMQRLPEMAASEREVTVWTPLRSDFAA